MEGASIPHSKSAELLAVLSAEPDQIRRVTRHTGWHGSSFVLPDMTIGPDAETLGYRQEEASERAQHVGGSLEDWRSALNLPCLASSYMTFGTALGFAGPLLQLIRQDEGASFYLCGKSSTGKTLSELAANQ
jgi:putative DNA primase/helicase